MVKHICMIVACFCLAITPIANAIAEDTEQGSLVPEYLQGISVTVKAGGAQGSGTIVSRIDEDGYVISFVWTAAHVIDELRHARKVVTPDGSTAILVEFRDPRIVAERYQDGRRVGEQTLDCKVIKYSDADYGEDLALLMVRLRSAYTVSTSAKFPEDSGSYIPQIGSELSHCGSLLGQLGSNSYTTGVLSQTGRLLDGEGASSSVFDQVTSVAFPGSSGGGVYLRGDGTYIGMLTRGYNMQGFNFIVPVRRMYSWAISADIGWAIDSTIEMPTMKDILLIPVEDAGAVPYGN